MELIDLRQPLPGNLGMGPLSSELSGLGCSSKSKLASQFPSLSLKELGAADLQKRRETKYTFRKDRLSTLLSGLESEYLILDIQGRRSFDYRSVYFDTPDRLFFKKHQAGALPRWKIRQRTYLNSGLTFLEVKLKDNRGMTHKSRQAIQNPMNSLSDKALCFIESAYPGQISSLTPCLVTRYSRITLVHKNREERITIDYQLRFNDGLNLRSLSNLAIAEVKQTRLNPRSLFINQLKRSGIRPGGFSKYCIGSVLLYPDLKHNRFKPTLHRISPLIQGDIYHERPQ